MTESYSEKVARGVREYVKKKMVVLEERQIFDHSLSDEERRVVERMLSKKFQIPIVGVDQEAEQKVSFP